MDDSGNRLLREAQVLLAAAQQFERDAGDRASATAVAPALASVEQALQALGRACEGAARSIAREIVGSKVPAASRMRAGA